MAINFDPYEQGGIMGPRQKQLIDQLQGGTAVSVPPIQAEPNAPQASPAPAFDPLQQVGHNGSINGLSREQYRDRWQGSGARSIGDLQNFIGQYGGRLDSGNGTVTTPFGEQIDMLQGARTNGNGSAAWGGVGSGSGNDAPAPVAASGGGGNTSLPTMLQGDPLAAIQQALSGYQQPGLLQQLIAALGGQ